MRLSASFSEMTTRRGRPDFTDLIDFSRFIVLDAL
jgi:hypothetical protein